MSGHPDEDGTRFEERSVPPSLLGWGARAFSLLALVGLFALIAAEALRPERPVRFEVTVEAGEARAAPGGGVLVPLVIENRGTRPVRELNLEIGSDPVRPLLVPLVGSREKLRYVVAFDRVPQAPAARIVSYASD